MVNVALIVMIGLLLFISFSWYAGLIREIHEEDLPEFERPSVLGKLLGPHLLDAVFWVLLGHYKRVTKDRRILKDFGLLRVLFATQALLIGVLVVYNAYAT